MKLLSPKSISCLIPLAKTHFSQWPDESFQVALRCARAIDIFCVQFYYVVRAENGLCSRKMESLHRNGALRSNLSAVCGIVKYALATAFLALAPLAARADEVMFRGQKIEYGGADLWNGRLARSISGRPRRLLF